MNERKKIGSFCTLNVASVDKMNWNVKEKKESNSSRNTIFRLKYFTRNWQACTTNVYALTAPFQYFLLSIAYIFSKSGKISIDFFEETDKVIHSFEHRVTMNFLKSIEVVFSRKEGKKKRMTRITKTQIRRVSVSLFQL